MHVVDAASGVYFLGERSTRVVGPKDILKENRGAM
jgi:hypothetical protein